jgi:ubiquinone/menaquinone biosynthesis C-methylase UbiE
VDASVTQNIGRGMPYESTKPPEELLTSLERLRFRTSEEFQGQLDERKRLERQWANFSRDKEHPQDTHGTSEQVRGNAKWYSTTKLSHQYLDQWLANHVAGKTVLDYACGNGDQVLDAAQKGANIAIGIDVSDVSIRNAACEAERLGLSDKCVFLEGDCENTGLPDNSVDVILCFGVLHHLDLSYAYPEMHRILKPGGCVLAAEALNYNPLIRLYRNFTPDMRTGWEKEHILSLKEVRAAKRYFNVGEIRFWHLLSVFGAFFLGTPPIFRALMPVLNGCDRLLTSIPGIQLMAWQFTFELFKTKI